MGYFVVFPQTHCLPTPQTKQNRQQAQKGGQLNCKNCGKPIKVKRWSNVYGDHARWMHENGRALCYPMTIAEPTDR